MSQVRHACHTSTQSKNRPTWDNNHTGINPLPHFRDEAPPPNHAICFIISQFMTDKRFDCG